MRLLLVDDDRSFSDALADGLRADGYEVRVAADGDDGLYEARVWRPHLMILDVMLPGLNGWDLCARLRAEGDFTPVLMLTARDGESDHTRSLDGGADDYLAKPFSYPVLLSRLRALARRTPQVDASRIELGDLIIEPASHRCWRADTEINLTPREMSLLAFLASHRDRVFTKGELLDAVWGLDFTGDDNVVEVYIRYLRQKVDRPFGRSTLETVRGVGYRATEHDR